VAVRVGTCHGQLDGAKNLDDGRVELDVEGTRTAIEALMGALNVGSPGGGNETRVEVK